MSQLAGGCCVEDFPTHGVVRDPSLDPGVGIGLAHHKGADDAVELSGRVAGNDAGLNAAGTQQGGERGGEVLTVAALGVEQEHLDGVLAVGGGHHVERVGVAGPQIGCQRLRHQTLGAGGPVVAYGREVGLAQDGGGQFADARGDFRAGGDRLCTAAVGGQRAAVGCGGDGVGETARGAFGALDGEVGCVPDACDGGERDAHGPPRREERPTPGGLAVDVDGVAHQAGHWRRLAPSQHAAFVGGQFLLEHEAARVVAPAAR